MPQALSVVRGQPPDGEPQDLVVLKPAAWQPAYGIWPELVLGRLINLQESGSPIEHTNFSPNDGFVQYLHQFIARHAPQQRALQATAHRQQQGWVYLIDQRPPVPTFDAAVKEGKEDIIGGFAILDGHIGAYHPNPAHRLFSAKGWCQLGYALEQLLLKDVMLARATRQLA
jgi:hypothetical protein